MTVAYATRTHFDQFGLPTATLDALASSTAQDAQLSSASGLMDSYFRGRWPDGLPFSSWGDELRECACVLAAYVIVARRGFNPDNAWEQALQARRAAWLAWLELVRDKKAHPDVTPLPSTTPSYSPSTRSSTLRGW